MEMQIQVQIGDTRRVFFMNPPRSHTELTAAISREIPKTSFMDIGLLYENDEGEYVVLNDNPLCLKIAISASKRIEGTDISRLKLRVFEGSSPSVKTKPIETARATSDRPKARSCLESDFPCNDSGKQDARLTPDIIADSSKTTSCDEKTPLERYIDKTEERLAKKRSVIQQLREKLHETEVKLEKVKSDPRDGNICRHCHLRLGHSARTCDYGKCSSVFQCGEEKFHPGELNMKEMRSEMKRHQGELNKLAEELDSKKSAIETVKDKVHNRIESDLFQANKTEYIVNGNKNWSLLRKHVYLVENYCKKNLGGKIPGKQDIQSILEKALTDNDSCSLSFYRSKQSGSRKRENPAKPLLERHGLEFPSSKRACSSSSNEKLPSQILKTAPRNEGEEAEQLAIVIRESMQEKSRVNTSNPCDFLPPPHPPFFWVPGFHRDLPIGTTEYPPNSIYSMQYPPVSAKHDPPRTCTVTCTDSTEKAECTSAKQESSDASEVEAASLLLSLSTHQLS